MQNTWLVVMPPLLVIIFACSTKRIMSSLFLGVFSALFIAHDFSLTKTIPAIFLKLWETTELSMMTSWESALSTSAFFISAFLLIISMLTMLLHESGGIFAYGNHIKKYLKDARHAEAAGFGLSLLLFIDDYFSSLTVGTVMRSVTDMFKIPRIKLALLTNLMAAPIALLAPVSSWVAEIVTNFRRSGIDTHGASVIIKADPFSLYLSIIPFCFYSLLVIIVLGYLIYRKISYGLIKQHEEIAQRTGNLFGGRDPLPELVVTNAHQQASLIDFIMPMAMLFVSIFTIMLLLGNFNGLGGTKSFIFSLQDAPKSASLFFGSSFTLLFSILFLVIRKKISPTRIPFVLGQGISLMSSSVAFLLLVWTLSPLLRTELATGQYLASFLGNNLPIALLPIIFFVFATIIGTLIGSAWGTMGILLPIAVEMAISILHLKTPALLSDITVIYPLLAAVISGAVISNNLSPVADTLMMSTKSAGAYHEDVVKAQSQYVFPLIIATAIAFLCAGLLITKLSLTLNALCSLSISTGISIIYFSWIKL